jgi:hypothetical protein
MCTEHFHTCKQCEKQYQCNEPDWICPTLNFDENSNMCKECEDEFVRDYLLMSNDKEEND